MKSGFLNHVKLKWKYYLLGILVSFVVSLITITTSSAPTRKEKISIFLSCYKTDYTFNDYIESIKPDYLEIIEVRSIHKNDLYYGTIIKGMRKTVDLFIVPESKIDYIITKNCLELTDNMIDDLTDNNYDYYSVDGINYGLKIYNKDNHQGILEDIVYFDSGELEEDYYLFINNKSYHMGDYNNSKYDGLVNVLKEILNYEKQGS